MANNLFALLLRIGTRLLHSLSFKLSFSVGLIIFLAVAAASWLQLSQQHAQALAQARGDVEGFAETVRRATFWSMLRNERDSLHRIVQDVAQQAHIERVRVFNKEGRIMFSSQGGEVGQEVDKQAEACYGCHAQEAPLEALPSGERTRVFRPAPGQRLMATILPIYNEPGCSGPPCHAHPPQQKVLGVLDVAYRLDDLDRRQTRQFWQTLAFGVGLFLAVSTIIGLAVILTVNRSVKRLVGEVDKVAIGEHGEVVPVSAPDELGQAAEAFNRMAKEVARRSRLKDQRYGQLVHNSTDAVLVIDAQGRVRVANPEAGRILGRAADQLEDAAFAELVAAEDRSPVLEAMYRALSLEETSRSLSFQVLAAEGEVRVLEGRFRRLEDDKGQRVVLANLRDITLRRALEEELARRRAFEQGLIHQALNAIIATDDQGLIQVFNESAETLLEAPSAGVVGLRHYSDFFPRALVRVLNKNIFHNPRRGEAIVRPGVVKTASGKRLPVLLSARPLFLNGRFSGTMLFLQNLRESKALKGQLIRQTRLAAVGQTAAGLAHCIKNLLHGMGTAAYLVDQGLGDGDLELTRQGWRMVKHNLDQVNGLSQDLLAYAKDRRPQYQPFDLNRLLEEVAGLVSGRSQELGVAVRVESDQACARVVLDPHGIRRVVLNLLSNALDALAEAPTPPAAPEVVLRCGRDGFGLVTISVSDNGPGISPEVRRHLFAGLFSTKGSRGTGLGLLVSQKIVDEHGGAIDCFSTPGQGARFTVVVPDLAEAEAAPAPEVPEA